jgi:hypothetical protein
MFAELRGSMAGMTAARNKGGNYLRARATPTNPNSTAQQRARDAFALAIQGWDTLTDAQRTGWEGYAAETPVVDALGTEIRNSGRNWYVAQFAFFAQLGEAAVSDAPTTPGLAALGEPNTPVQLSAANGLSADFSEAPTLAFVIAQAGPPISAGVTYFKGPYTRISFEAGEVTAGRYGLPVLGQIRPMRFRGITAVGKLTNVFEAKVTVIA